MNLQSSQAELHNQEPQPPPFKFSSFVKNPWHQNTSQHLRPLGKGPHTGLRKPPGRCVEWGGVVLRTPGATVIRCGGGRRDGVSRPAMAARGEGRSRPAVVLVAVCPLAMAYPACRCDFSSADRRALLNGLSQRGEIQIPGGGIAAGGQLPPPEQSPFTPTPHRPKNTLIAWRSLGGGVPGWEEKNMPGDQLAAGLDLPKMIESLLTSTYRTFSARGGSLSVGGWLGGTSPVGPGDCRTGAAGPSIPTRRSPACPGGRSWEQRVPIWLVGRPFCFGPFFPTFLASSLFILKAFFALPVCNKKPDLNPIFSPGAIILDQTWMK